jgi:hypothetical protein
VLLLLLLRQGPDAKLTGRVVAPRKDATCGELAMIDKQDFGRFVPSACGMGLTTLCRRKTVVPSTDH